MKLRKKLNNVGKIIDNSGLELINIRLCIREKYIRKE